MSSRPRNFIILIGAARAVPYPVPSNSTHDPSERHFQFSVANDDAAGHVRLIASTPSSTIDLADLVTPVTPSSTIDLGNLVTPVNPASSTVYELTEITPVTEPTSSTQSELTEITPVPESTSSPQTIYTITPVPPSPTTESATPAQSLPASPSITTPSTGRHISTFTITDWVTVTVAGTPGNDPATTTTLPAGSPGPTETQTSGSETVPITVIPVNPNRSMSRRPDLPGGIMGGPPQPNVDETGEDEPKE